MCISTSRGKKRHHHEVGSSGKSSSAKVDFHGHYKRTYEKNYSSFLSEIGVGYFLRRAALAGPAEMIIKRTAERGYKVTQSSSLMGVEVHTVEFKFESGEPFHELTQDGREVESVILIEGAKWIHKQKDPASEKKDVTIIREFSDMGCDVTFICGHIEARVFYHREED